MKNTLMIRIISILFSAGFTIVGFLFLLNSVDWGSESARNYLMTVMGGKANSNEYQFIFENYINTYKWIGSILLFIGGVFFLRNIERVDFFKKN